MATVGYIVSGCDGPLAQYQTNQGFYILGPAGGARRYAKVFTTRDAAKTSILADREYRRHTNQPLPDDRKIVRLAT